ncbi:MAG: CatA-like O-acetyltransferase [Clostridiales bacterium]|nr:CatA-like O-acetyltransferase [Clostridiales bacterium]
MRQDLHPPPENAYTVSCLPWVSFDHFAVHSYGASPYYFPSVEAGRFIEENGRTLLPLSVTCHHAATDGWHVRLFLEELQALMDSFEAVLV